MPTYFGFVLRENTLSAIGEKMNIRSRFVPLYAWMCLLILNKYVITNDEIKSNKKIIIIGAGAAGIAAASKLFENGFKNVKILEAENRIGGRLYTKKIGDYFVDVGGQWVHGEKDNVAYNLANPLALLSPDNGPIRGKLFDSSGNRINGSINKELEHFFLKYFEQAGAPHITGKTAESIGEFIERKYREEFKNNTEMTNLRAELLYYLEIMELDADAADSWKDVSNSDINGYVVRKGNQDVPWRTTGYGTILDILMKRYPDTQNELPVINNTMLNTEVTLINYTNGHPVLVSTRDGQNLEADHVIVTVSLGVLKAHHESIFVPPLPSKKVDAIEYLGFGNAAKVYFLFEEPFLQGQDNTTMTHFGFLWTSDDRKAIENDPEKMWMLGVSGVWPVEFRPKLIEFFIPSKWAEAMEKIDEQKVYNQTFELLQRFMGKTYNISKPIFMMRTQWHTNPHFRGAYSYHSVKAGVRHIHPQMLQESITQENHRILFAGEATSPGRFSTADGAIESGWTAADNIINLYKT